LSGSEWHAPSVFWTVRGTDRDAYANAKEAGRLAELPTNHNPRFAPVVHDLNVPQVRTRGHDGDAG
jgi:hippurate hydrolase